VEAFIQIAKQLNQTHSLSSNLDEEILQAMALTSQGDISPLVCNLFFMA